MKAFLMGSVIAICVAVVGGWVLQDYASESSAQAYTSGAARLD
jgi:hypothetical protein